MSKSKIVKLKQPRLRAVSLRKANFDEIIAELRRRGGVQVVDAKPPVQAVAPQPAQDAAPAEPLATSGLSEEERLVLARYTGACFVEQQQALINVVKAQGSAQAFIMFASLCIAGLASDLEEAKAARVVLMDATTRAYAEPG